MPVTKTLLAPNSMRKWNLVVADARPPFFTSYKKNMVLLGPDSSFSTSAQILKIAAEFDASDFTSIRATAYLYQPSSGTVSNAATCTFNFYKVTTPSWTEELQASLTAPMTYNQHFFLDVPETSFPTMDFSGGDTLMIEAVVTRLGETYRDRVYVNHLGIYDSLVRLKNKVTFLELTKKDE